MKSLEETIKLKCKFLGERITPLYFSPTYLHRNSSKVFVSKNNIETKDEITLLEEMIPLLHYIFSCINYSGR